MSSALAPCGAGAPRRLNSEWMELPLGTFSQSPRVICRPCASTARELLPAMPRDEGWVAGAQATRPVRRAGFPQGISGTSDLPRPSDGEPGAKGRVFWPRWRVRALPSTCLRLRRGVAFSSVPLTLRYGTDSHGARDADACTAAPSAAPAAAGAVARRGGPVRSHPPSLALAPRPVLPNRAGLQWRGTQGPCSVGRGARRRLQLCRLRNRRRADRCA